MILRIYLVIVRFLWINTSNTQSIRSDSVLIVKVSVVILNNFLLYLNTVDFYNSVGFLKKSVVIFKVSVLVGNFLVTVCRLLQLCLYVLDQDYLSLLKKGLRGGLAGGGAKVGAPDSTKVNRGTGYNLYKRKHF